MAVKMTFHGAARPMPGPGGAIDVLGKQIGDAIATGSPLVAPGTGLYTIWATADHTIKITDPSGSNAANGEEWASGEKQIRALNENDEVHFS
jgi:hypothetical protein